MFTLLYYLHLFLLSFRSNIVYGCDGAALNGYVKWFNQKSPSLASEKGYPYTAKRDTCQEYDPYFQGKPTSLSGLINHTQLLPNIIRRVINQYWILDQRCR